MFTISTNKIVDALKPHGPTPIVTTVTGMGAFAALSAGANPFAVVAIAFLVFVTHIYGLERNAALRKKEIEFDQKAREVGGAMNHELQKRFERFRE